MKASFASLRRLRWKLTFSYTLVTVVALILTWLILVGSLVALLKTVDSSVGPLLVRDMKNLTAPRLEPGLAQMPPDKEGLDRELRVIAQETEAPGTVEGSQQEKNNLQEFMELMFGEGNRSLLLIDDRRRVLAIARGADGQETGRGLDTGRFPGLEPTLTAALNGERDPEHLHAFSPAGDRAYLVAPVESDDGRVLGVVVDTYALTRLTPYFFVAVLVGALILTIPAAILGTIFGSLTARGLTRRFQRLARSAQSWSRGDFSVKVQDGSKDELGQLSRELNDMAAELESLIQARGELAMLEARNRFARDLHDSVKQQVYATSLQVDTARALMEPEAKADAHLVKARSMLQGAQKELNVLIHEMRPAALEGKGLAAALRDYATDWSRGSEIPVEVRVRGEREVPLETEQALFRVTQEALANVARHSRAKNVEIDLDYDAHDLILHVADDGRGFDPAAPNKGFGLRSMRERLTRLGGRAEIRSAPRKGTRVHCVCPTGCPEGNGAGES